MYFVIKNDILYCNHNMFFKFYNIAYHKIHLFIHIFCIYSPAKKLYNICEMGMKEKILKEQLGSKIRQYLKRLNLTQESFGEKINRDQRQISLIENGVCFPTPEILIKMSDIFNCKIRDLFDFYTIDDIKNVKLNIYEIISNLTEEKLRIVYSILKNI